jgi:hypothetical protein
MATRSKVWGIRLAILLATCVGVFVAPFLLPARYFQGVSASNLAGFNNEVAALAAASVGTLVFLLALKWPQISGEGGFEPAADGGTRLKEHGRISRGLVGVVVLLWGGAVFLFGVQIIRSGMRYEYDWGYFLNRISVHADFGRKLYSQMEFPYGPWLLEFPIAVRAILSPFHVSTAGAYLLTLVLEVMVGLLLLAYLINHLPMSKRWRAIIFLLLSAGMMVGNMGPNHTFVRFAPQLVFLVLAWKRKRGWEAAVWIFAGQALCLGLSPEIGFAFLVGSFAFGLYCYFTRGRTWAWAAAAPIVSAMLFLIIEGWPYLNRVGSSAHGVYSFPVEPLPIRLGVAGSGKSCALFPPATSRGADVGRALSYVAGAAAGGLWEGRPGTCVLERPFGIAIVCGGYFISAPVAANRLGRLSRNRDSMDVQYKPTRELV